MDRQSVSDEQLGALARRLGEALRRYDLAIATAESCTGGWVAQAITSVPGSSQWFERGFITYSNRAKQEMLGVREATLEAHGAVSEATVTEMAEGVLRHSRAQVGLAVSGIAGPGGGVLDKPVGTVCLAWAGVGVATRACTEHYAGGRQEIRRAAVAAALAGVLDLLTAWP